MILPIDRRVNDRIPYATYGLIAANSLILLFVVFAARDLRHLEAIYRDFGFVPSSVRAHAVLTHMFMHGGIWHLIGNMVFLGFFGLNVERRLGSFLYLSLYVLSGLTSLGLFLVFDPRSDGPLVGASGAISGVTGMYLALYQGRLVDVFSIAGPFRARAISFILIWAGVEVFNALVLGGKVTVAHWAHVGGFAGGWAAVSLLLRAGFRGYPEKAPDRPKDLAASFTQLRYIPVRAQTVVRSRDRYALVFDRYAPAPPAAAEILPPGAVPACAAGDLSLEEARDLRRRLEGADLAARIVPERHLVRFPPLEIVTGIAVGGQLSIRDEIGREVARDPACAYFLSAGRVKTRLFLDLFVTSPWTDYRLSDALGTVDLGSLAGDLRHRLPDAFFTPGAVALGQGRADLIPEFSGQKEYDDYNRWALQSRVMVGDPATG